MLKGKIAVITGANRGIGFATVETFAKNGATIWACARTRSVEFEEELQSLSDRNQVAIHPLYFDIKDRDAVKKALRTVGDDQRRIDILVNNAGISEEGLFQMTSIDMMRETMETNFYSQIYISQIVSRYMIRNKSGRIVNIASVTGIEPKEGGIAYGSSKSAVIFSTGTMALELGKYGIRVNSVSPGFIDTDMWKNRKEEVKRKLLSETSLGRQGTTDEVAQVILFLASDMSSFITGQNIVVDGGRKLGF